MKKIILLVLPLILCFGCENPSDFSDNKSNIKYINSLAIDTSRILIVRDFSIVLFSPDSTDVNLLKQKMPENQLKEVISDNDYYFSEAISLTEKKGVKTHFTTKKVLYFICDNDTFKMKTNNHIQKWGAVAFNSCKLPQFISLTDFKEGIDEYFK